MDRTSKTSRSSWSTPKASDGTGGRTTKTKGGGNAHLQIEVRSIMGNADEQGSQTCGPQELQGPGGGNEGRGVEQPGCSPWADLEWLPCSDGKARPTQSGIFPLAHGVSGRVGRLRAYGNAIVPQVAAEFIRAADEAIERPRHIANIQEPM